ncbi:AI-2E family transporter [Flavobacterium sp. UBA6135]|uniref:AI-2E family transporter n=1 Tax=Flavobacterium sp. UBA6135 TaxID=1946553 RepID=UPI0025C3C698|nr:AI-2E family transporter [Flavobacterium sp. UBA6135]
MITSKIIANGILRALFILALISIVLLFIYSIKTVLIYLIIALIFSLICNPIVEFLIRRLKFKNSLAVLFTIGIMLALFLLFILMIVPLITEQAKNLSLLDTQDIQSKVTLIFMDFQNYFNQQDAFISDQLKDVNLSSYVDFNFLTGIFNNFISMISGFLMGLATVLFISFFFLKDKVIFISGIKSIIPSSHETETLNSFKKIYDLLSRYFSGLLLQLFIVFVLYFIVLLIFGISNAFVIAFFCAILNIIPYIGPLIGSILAATLTMISNIGSDFQTEILPKTIYVLIGFVIVQLIDNNLNQPLIFSKSTKSHPLEIFLVILISGFISGIVGMIVAVPVYTILKVIAKEFFPKNSIVKAITRKL